MPIATATTIIVIIVYILLHAVSRTGELLLKTFHGNAGDRTNNGGASLLPLRNARVMTIPQSANDRRPRSQCHRRRIRRKMGTLVAIPALIQLG